MEEIREDIWELVQIPGPSGFEEKVAEFIERRIQPYVKQIKRDDMGNLLAVKNGPSGAPIFVLMAHMDEVSMVALNVDEDFVRFEYVGSINPAVTVGQPMLVLSRNGLIPGVVCSPSVHLSQSVGNLWLDVGSRIKSILPGDPIIFDTKPRWLDDEREILATKAVDDRTGCAVLIDVARKLKNINLNINLIFAFTVQEEVGARGAEYLARQIHPTYVIAVDNSYATDLLTGKTQGVELGKGPLIRKFESAKPGRGMLIQFGDRKLIEELWNIAKNLNIPAEIDARFNLYTDASGAYEAFSDIKCTSLTMPRRYSHSPYEVTHLRCLANTSKLLVEYFTKNWPL